MNASSQGTLQREARPLQPRRLGWRSLRPEQAAPRRRLSYKAKEQLAGVAFASPWLLGFLAFTLVPLVLGAVYSFTNYHLLNTPHFIGTANYRLLAQNPSFAQSLFTTGFLLLVGVPATVLFPLGYALLMNAAARFQRTFRTMMFVPSLIPAAASGLVWAWLFNTNFGLVNDALRFAHMPTPNWLGTVWGARSALVIIQVWGAGTSAILLLAGLQDIPAELLDAARVDGAGAWSRFWHITLPKLSPVLFFNVVYAVLGVIQLFTQPMVMFGTSLYVALTFVFDVAFNDLAIGAGAAASWIVVLGTVAIVLLLFRTQRWWVHYD
jgi:multiple sugar transport system permease protein